ncbi:MAG TPA: alpha/beta hydrolase [Ktedonobacteraceae bacterium]
MPTAKVNEIQIYYEIHGEGEPLVFIGGLATDITEFEGIIRELSQNYRVIAFDNRGAGRTDKPDIPYSIEMMADDTAGLLNALGIERANMLGISMGGRIALALAIQHPKLVTRLVLVSTSAKSSKRKWRLRLLSILTNVPIFRSKYPQPHYAFLRQRNASRSYDATDWLHEIRMPTLILHGKKDKTTPYKLAEEMHAGIAGSKMIAFNGGHLFFFIRQKQFLDAVSDFLGSAADSNLLPGQR